MPQYTYVCLSGHNFAKVRKIEERDLPIECPEPECDEKVERTEPEVR